MASAGMAGGSLAAVRALSSAFADEKSCAALGLLRELFRLWRKSHAGVLGFAQAYEGAALDPRRDFVPFETHSGGSLV